MKAALIQCMIAVAALAFMPGCATRKVVIRENEAIRWLPPHQTHQAGPEGIWLVPDETMRLLLRHWAQREP